MKRTVVLQDTDTAGVFQVVAEAANLAEAKKAMRDLPDGLYHVASFMAANLEVREPKRAIRKVVSGGTSFVSRARNGSAPKRVRKKAVAQATA